MYLEEAHPNPRIFVLQLGFFSGCCSVTVSKHSGCFAALMLNALSFKKKEKKKRGIQLKHFLLKVETR